MKELLHFDPVTIIVVIIGFIANQYFGGLLNKKTSDWHTQWIKKHSAECDEQRKQNNEILTELRTTNAQLVTLTTGHHERITRIEHQMDQTLTARK